MRKIVVGIVAATALVHGQIQAQDAAPMVKPGGTLKTSFLGKTNQDDLMFDIDLARLSLWGQPTEMVTYKTQFDFVYNRDTVTSLKAALADAYISAKPVEMLSISMGQTKKPLGGEWQLDPAAFDFYAPSAVTKLFGSYEVGAWVTATPMEMIAVTIGGFNGQGRSAADTDQYPAFAFRVQSTPMEGVKAGVGLWWQRYKASKENQIQFGFDVEYKMDPIKVNGEFAFENNNDNGSGGASALNVDRAAACKAKRAWAGYLSSVYTMMENHGLGLRYDIWDESNEVKGENHRITARYGYSFTSMVSASFDLSFDAYRGMKLDKTLDNFVTYQLGMTAAI